MRRWRDILVWAGLAAAVAAAGWCADKGKITISGAGRPLDCAPRLARALRPIAARPQIASVSIDHCDVSMRCLTTPADPAGLAKEAAAIGGRELPGETVRVRVYNDDLFPVPDDFLAEATARCGNVRLGDPDERGRSPSFLEPRQPPLPTLEERR